VSSTPIKRVVYDTMVFFQWATLPEGRQHATTKAVLNGSVQLCVSLELLAEVKDLLTRPAIVAKAQNLTNDRVDRFLEVILQYAEIVPSVPNVFSWQQHPDDDHVFNLAIHAKADYLVTWESRILKLASDMTPDALLLRRLAPQLAIITPKMLSEQLRSAESP
jgi:putative PIN family toxin of toxin-antitoxin system